MVRELEIVQLKAVKVILGCSQRTSNAAVRTELGILFLKTKRDVRKLKWQYRLHKMKEKRLPKSQEQHTGNHLTGIESLLSGIPSGESVERTGSFSREGDEE